MIFAIYCYRESEPCDNEDDHHIDRVEFREKDREDRDAELVEPINQYMEPPSQFEVVNGHDQYG
jgi:hypothetical protein